MIISKKPIGKIRIFSLKSRAKSFKKHGKIYNLQKKKQQQPIFSFNIKFSLKQLWQGPVYATFNNDEWLHMLNLKQHPFVGNFTLTFQDQPSDPEGYFALLNWEIFIMPFAKHKIPWYFDGTSTNR